MHAFRPHPDVTVLNDYVEIPGLGFLPINAFVLRADQPVVLDTGLGLPDRPQARAKSPSTCNRGPDPSARCQAATT